MHAVFFFLWDRSRFTFIHLHTFTPGSCPAVTQCSTSSPLRNSSRAGGDKLSCSRTFQWELSRFLIYFPVQVFPVVGETGPLTSQFLLLCFITNARWLISVKCTFKTTWTLVMSPFLGRLLPRTWLLKTLRRFQYKHLFTSSFHSLSN